MQTLSHLPSFIESLPLTRAEKEYIYYYYRALSQAADTSDKSMAQTMHVTCQELMNRRSSIYSKLNIHSNKESLAAHILHLAYQHPQSAG